MIITNDDLDKYGISFFFILYTTNRRLGEYYYLILFRYSITCKYHLKYIYTYNLSISKSFLYSRQQFRGPIVRLTGWYSSYPEDEINHVDTVSLAALSYNMKDLLLQMKLEERAYYEYQIKDSNNKLIKIGQRYL